MKNYKLRKWNIEYFLNIFLVWLDQFLKKIATN